MKKADGKVAESNDQPSLSRTYWRIPWDTQLQTSGTRCLCSNMRVQVFLAEPPEDSGGLLNKTDNDIRKDMTEAATTYKNKKKIMQKLETKRR